MQQKSKTRIFLITEKIKNSVDFPFIPIISVKMQSVYYEHRNAPRPIV
jgi:hypothetical protein